MRLVFALLMAVLAPGCGEHWRAGVVADANPECYQAHVASTTDTGVRWECAAEDPACWDDLGERVVPLLVAGALGGERSRQSCVDFIRSLHERGVIRNGKP